MPGQETEVARSLNTSDVSAKRVVTMYYPPLVEAEVEIALGQHVSRVSKLAAIKLARDLLNAAIQW